LAFFQRQAAQVLIFEPWEVEEEIHQLCIACADGNWATLRLAARGSVASLSLRAPAGSRAACGGFECVLQCLEVGLAMLIQHHDFTVIPTIGKLARLERTCEPRHAAGPVQPVSRDELWPAPADPRHDAIAVVLQLVA